MNRPATSRAAAGAVAVVSGALFGAGLVVSGLANPVKVLNFLDLAGTWDPSLAIVMAVGVAVTFTGYRLLRQREGPWFADTFQWPTRRDIDARLVGGAALFGVGWGVAGYCPGPALTALTINPPEGFVFVTALVAGLLLARRLA